MTKEEAIQYIDGLRCEEDFPYTDTIAYFIKERNEAIDMAIEALSTDTDGEDLIIKGAKGIKDGLYNIQDGKLFKYKANGGTVRTYPIVPSADAVPQSEQYKKGFEDAKRAYEIELARSADTVHGEWMPCSERLPIPPMFCLVTTDGSHGDVIDIALYMSDGWHKASEVIAWMPLPTPYKGGDDE